MDRFITSTVMKSYRDRILLISLFSLFVCTTTLAQETLCANGIDDDGDGLIDCYDGDCANSPDGVCDQFYVGGSLSCIDDPTGAPTFKMKQQWGSANQTADSYATPIVGDLDGNGVPEVVSVNWLQRKIYVLDGATGATLDQVDVKDDEGNSFYPMYQLAIGNVNNDECAWIFVTELDKDDLADSHTINAYDCNLDLQWSVETSIDYGPGIPGLADFNQDGVPELYYKNEIRNARTGAVLVAGSEVDTYDWYYTEAFGPLAIDVLPDGACADCSGLELVTGSRIYSVNIPNGSSSPGSKTIERDMDDVLNAMGESDYSFRYYRTTISAADYNLDGHVDILMPGAIDDDDDDPQTTVFFWDVTNNTVDYYQDLGNNWNRGTGRINIANIDDDGLMNAVFVSGEYLYALDENMDYKWSIGIKETSSGFTGCTLFDFNGDGESEIIYRSEESLLVIDGYGNENTAQSKPCISRTAEEYPVVADVDGDGASEICVTCTTNNSTDIDGDNWTNTQYSQVRVFEADGEVWMPSRSVWNQHAYFNTNVNDDLSIPRVQQDHTESFATTDCDGNAVPGGDGFKPLNGFLNQSSVLGPAGCAVFTFPDFEFGGNVSATSSDCPNTTFEVTFDISNIGDTDMSGNIPVTFYAGDPRVAGSIKLNTEIATITNLQVDDSQSVTLDVDGIGGTFTLYISINDYGQTPAITDFSLSTGVVECDATNNLGFIVTDYVPFEIVANPLRDNQKCVDSKPDNGQAEAYFEGTVAGSRETIWLESFDDLSTGVTSDAGTTGWNSAGDGNTRSGSFGVQTSFGSKAFEGENTGGNFESGPANWTSNPITISGHTDINITVDLLSTDNCDGSWSNGRDRIRFWYNVDNTGDILLTNGNKYGSFEYVQASITGLSGSSVVLKAKLNTSSNDEIMAFDNVKVTGIGGDVTKEFTESDGYTFNWYLGEDFSTVLYTGSTYTGMAEGTYSVIGAYSASNCYSDTIRNIEIELVTEPQFLVEVYEVQAHTDCVNPNGIITAFAYTDTLANGDPADTLTTGYSFNWYLGSDQLSVIGTGSTLPNLEGALYSVVVTESATGCISGGSGQIDPPLATFSDPVVNVTDITTCGGTGSLSATVDGGTSGFTFLWYVGSNIKPTTDFEGSSWTGLAQGEYTVRAQNNTSQCTSNPITVEIVNTSSAPSPTAEQTEPSTGCDIGNGRIAATGNGSTVTGFTYEWFVGNNTAAGNALPGTANENAFYVNDNTYELGGLDPGTYTVRVTRTSDNCSNTTTAVVADEREDPLIVDETEIIINNTLSCDVTVNGNVDISELIDISQTVLINNINGSFEEPYNPTSTNHAQNFGSNVKNYHEDNVTGWSTTATDNRIEIWHESTTYSGLDAYEGEQWAEINANQDAGLYFDLNTQPGVEMIWRFAHSGRSGTDVLGLYIGPPSGPLVQITTASTGVGWQLYEGTYTVPEGQYFTRFEYRAISSTGGNTYGNFIDGVEFYMDPFNFEGYLTNDLTGDPVYANDNGVFENVEDGSYTFYVQDNYTGCQSADINVIVEREQAFPSLTISNLVDDDYCVDGNGSFKVTSSSTPEPSSYTYELFDGFNTTPANLLQTEIVTDGSVGFTFTDLEDGDYRILVTNDSLTCETFEDVEIGDISEVLTATTTKSDNVNCTTPAGFIEVSSIVGESGPTNLLLSETFTFAWYTGSTVNVANLIAGETTYRLEGIDEGTYTVVATNDETGCPTTTKVVSIIDNPAYPSVTIDQVQAQTGCGTGSGANGIAEAYVLDEFGDPTTEGHTFEWFSDAGLTTAIASNNDGSTSETTDGLEQGTYYVRVTNALTECSIVRNLDIDYTPIAPILSEVSTSDNTGCNATSYDGEALVAVSFNSSNVSNPSASGYTFDWFYSDGTQVTNGGTVAGAETENPTGLVNDDYKVTVTSPTECTSDTLTVTIDADPDVNPTATEEETNTGCTINNGEISATGDGTSTTLANFDFEWFLGNNTDAANALPGTVNPNAYNVNDNEWELGGLAGNQTYTVRVTNTINGCVATTTVFVNDDSEDPLLVDETDIVITPQNSCDPGNYGGSVDISEIIANTQDRSFNNENGGFEEIYNSSGAIDDMLFNDRTGQSSPSWFSPNKDEPLTAYYEEEWIPGWVTDDNVNNVIEFFRTGYTNGVTFSAYEGTQWAELNAHANAALYFDMPTQPGTTMIWRFAHRARNNGTDCMRLRIGDRNLPINSLPQEGPNFCSIRTNTGAGTENGWNLFEGTYVVPDGQYFTRFAYQAVSSVGGNALEGNFIDGVEFYMDPYTYEGELADGSGTVIPDDDGDGVYVNLKADTYTFTLSDNYTGCESDPINVVVPNNTDSPEFRVNSSGTNDNTICDEAIAGSFNGQITLERQDGILDLSNFSFDWYDGPNTSAATAYDNSTLGVYSELPGGTYTVEIQDLTTLCDTTFQVTIDDSESTTFQSHVPSATPSDVTTCFGGTDYPNGSITVDESAITTAGGSGDYTYRYYVGSGVSGTLISNGDNIGTLKGGSAVSNTVSGATTNTITNLDSGNYTIEVLDNLTGCLTQPSVVAIELDPSVPTAAEDAGGTNNNEVCNPDLTDPSVEYSGQITATIGNTFGDFTFTWYEGTSTAAADVLNDDATDTGSAISGTDTTRTGNSVVLSNIPGGTYTLEIESVTSGCTETFEFDIDDATSPIAAVTPSATATHVTYCSSENGEITVDPTNITTAGGSGNYTYNY
ncbi:MAG: hypothetical protein RIC35_18300, partial [Marinoscillum sp.]